MEAPIPHRTTTFQGSLLNAFVYEPLQDKNCIRILTLEPGSGADPLVGSLRTESLEPDGDGQLPAYEAISYVWGTKERCSELICDGAALPLTQSIYDALVRVRLPSEPRRLWADQICINQDDVAERSQQVKLMNAVYKNASRVLVWLGRDPEGVAEDAFQMVYHLDGVFNDDKAHEEFRIAHSENLARQRQEPWIPLAKLTRLPWFQRIWIVQEIGTAAPATLYWGNAEMDWNILSTVAGILNQSYHHLRTRFYIGTSNVRYLHQRFVEPEVAYDQYHNRGSFVYELHRARHLLAHDPRDHVYAFLGHFSIKICSKGLEGLVADYSKPVEDVFIDVAVRDLRGADNLLMLSANHNCQPDVRRLPTQEMNRKLDLPSWVPDWRDLPVHVIGSPQTPHRAAGESKPDLKIDEASRTLHIQGWRVDVIDRHSWTFHTKAFQFRHDNNAGSLSQGHGHWDQHHQHNHNHNHDHAHTHPNATMTHTHNQPQSQTQSQPQGNTPNGPASSFQTYRQGLPKNPPQHRQPQRKHPIEVFWLHFCGYSSFTLSHIYPPFRKGATAMTATADTSNHRNSAFFALMQTLTNACIGADRTRDYESVPSEEWLASGAAYLIKATSSSKEEPSRNTKNIHQRNNSSSSNNNNNNASTTSPSTAKTPQNRAANSTKNNSFWHKANALNNSSSSSSSYYSSSSSASPHVPISPDIHQICKAHTGDPFKWSHEASLVTRYRRFAVTRRGYYVLGPDALERGDTIVVLKGGRTPFILRPVSSNKGISSGRRNGNNKEKENGGSDGWILIGECYVHGLMNGEVYGMEGLAEETFSVR